MKADLTRQIAESLWGPELIAQFAQQLERSESVHRQHSKTSSYIGCAIGSFHLHPHTPNSTLYLATSFCSPHRFDLTLTHKRMTALRLHCADRHWLNAMILIATSEETLVRKAIRISGGRCLSYSG